MTTLHDVEKAVAKLTPDDLGKFRRWFAQYDGKIWDDQIEADAAAGKLDKLANEALAEYRAGKATAI